MIYIENTMVRTAKSEIYLGNMGESHPGADGIQYFLKRSRWVVTQPSVRITPAPRSAVKVLNPVRVEATCSG